jgi:hypothetical protein
MMLKCILQKYQMMKNEFNWLMTGDQLPKYEKNQ